MILAAPVRIVSSPATNTTGVCTPAIVNAGAVMAIAGVLLACVFNVKCHHSSR
jgi:hypothetical protein